MNNRLLSFAIISEPQDYSACCMRDSLDKLGYAVDLVSLSAVTTDASVRVISSANELADYDVIIYQSSYCFTTFSAWFYHYQGVLLILYSSGIPLPSLRAFHHASARVHALELARQAMSEWVQANAQRVFWVADAVTSAQDLSRWGVRLSFESLAICPPFIPLDLGIYRQSKTKPTDSSLHLLVAGDFIADTGHKLFFKLFSAYQQQFPTTLRVHFVGCFNDDMCVYKENLLSLIAQQGLSQCVHFELLQENTAIDLHYFLQADVLLYLDSAKNHSTHLIRAQAMGLPSIRIDNKELTISGDVLLINNEEDYLSVARFLDKAAFDPATRQQLIVDGYRRVSMHFSYERIEQQFLTYVFEALKQFKF